MTNIAIRGNMTAPVEIRFTSSGKAVGSVTVAVNRGKDDNKQTDFHRVTLWESLAENAAQLEKGTSVLVIGRIESREYEARDGGGKRTAWEVTADAFGPDMRFQTVTVQKTSERGAQAPQRPSEPETWSGGGSYGDETPF